MGNGIKTPFKKKPVQTESFFQTCSFPNYFYVGLPILSKPASRGNLFVHVLCPSQVYEANKLKTNYIYMYMKTIFMYIYTTQPKLQFFFYSFFLFGETVR